MGDIFREQLVKKLPDQTTILKKAALVTAPVLVYLVLALFLPPVVGSIALIGFVVACSLSVYLWKRLDIEYEYILLGKEIDVDIIYSKSKRKRLLTLSLEQAQVLAPAGSAKLDDYSRLAKKDLTGGSGQDVWVLVTKVGMEQMAVSLELYGDMIEDLSNVIPNKLVRN
ncbi:MAG: hypothetical protein SPL15_07250 [Lachnospiraceae bacterium]|nr:hypothetical protein [Lachnospiraceae bacterium]MDY5742771.1 hypothetical protein [Lachnospiraceae bacterium]